MTDLILVPTPIELEPLRRVLDRELADSPHAFQLCGFGPIAAAARTSSLIARYEPDRVLLIGIAGTYVPDRFGVGTACRFDEVICHGVGVGTGDTFRSAGELGWQHFGSEQSRPHIGDRLPLVSTYLPDVPCAGQLLTCASASANATDAKHRQVLYPNAVAEDMEGFGVATACALVGVPLQIVRGLSNVVGDRNHSHWKINEALSAAAEMAIELVGRPWIPTES